MDFEAPFFLSLPLSFLLWGKSFASKTFNFATKADGKFVIRYQPCASSRLSEIFIYQTKEIFAFIAICRSDYIKRKDSPREIYVAEYTFCDRNFSRSVIIKKIFFFSLSLTFLITLFYYVNLRTIDLYLILMIINWVYKQDRKI